MFRSKLIFIIFIFLNTLFISNCVTTDKTTITRIPLERFYKIVDFGKYTIHFCSHKEMFLDNRAFRDWDKENKSEVDGFYDHNTKSIWVWAYKDENGDIWPWSECLLGHEFQHLLNHIDSIIANPDPSSRKKEIEIID